MKIVRTIADARDALRGPRGLGKTIGFVPTMGSLHEGHLSLLRRAREENDVVVASVFVNPIQFDDPNDFRAYPRDLAVDAEFAASAGTDLVFSPEASDMYPDGFFTTVTVRELSETLEGAVRGPGHFTGVATVVAKLFNIVQPNVAYFGQKDAQQLLIVRRMVRDLAFPVRIEPCPIVREPDGLAMSSRNVRLAPADRPRALALKAALDAAQTAVDAGERNADAITVRAKAKLAEFGVDAEYCALVDPDDLEPMTRIDDRALLAIAARVGGVRLIDNAILETSRNTR